MSNKYKNPWYKETTRTTSEYYENNARQVLEHRDVKVYKLFENSYDFVLNGCCITQRAGITEAQREIDKLLDGKTPTCDTVASHLRANGHKPITYDQYTQLWLQGKVA